jgi:hypothetical protein
MQLRPAYLSVFDVKILVFVYCFLLKMMEIMRIRIRENN